MIGPVNRVRRLVGIEFRKRRLTAEKGAATVEVKYALGVKCSRDGLDFGPWIFALVGGSQILVRGVEFVSADIAAKAFERPGRHLADNSLCRASVLLARRPAQSCCVKCPIDVAG